MKALALLTFAALTLPAQALTLMPAACNAYCACSNVATDDPEVVVDFVNPTTVSLGGVTYTGPAVYPSQMFAADGSTRIVSLTFRKWTTRTTSGRGGGYYLQHCALVDGRVE